MKPSRKRARSFALTAVCLGGQLITPSKSISIQQQSASSNNVGQPYQSTARFIPSERKASSYSLSGIRHLFPVQRFIGPPVKPCKRLPPIDLASLVPGNKSFQDSLTDKLSESSRFLLEKYSTLDEIERKNLKMKIAAEARASQPLNADDHLRIIYVDEHICVVSKPSGVLSVPGPRRNPSIASLVHDTIKPEIDVDQMIVHRIDMDTSGILVYALTAVALSKLHDDFRKRRVKKSYEALLAGHLKTTSQVEIDLALERDPFHPPFMRVAQREENAPVGSKVENIDLIHPSFRKFMDQAPKPSLSELTVLSYEYLHGIPVTRVALTPHTGRTHQLRVHCAALGFPIVGDDIYGLYGEGDCGIDPETFRSAAPKWKENQEDLLELDLPLCLHAKKLCVYHPVSGAAMEFEMRPSF